jgi:hypothetical protein
MDRKLPRITYEEDEALEESVAPSSQFFCADCKVQSPPTRTGTTLITSKYGWRAVRVATPDGPAAEWRCPPCWATYRTLKLSPT